VLKYTVFIFIQQSLIILVSEEGGIMSNKKAHTLFIDYAANLKLALINQRVLVYALLGLLVLLTVDLVYLSTHQAEFILPYGFNKKVSLIVNYLTPTYISALGLSDAATYFNIDRNNIDEQQALFLSRVWPLAEKSIVPKLKQRSAHFHSNDIAQQFYPYERHVEQRRQNVVIKGRLVRWLSGKCLFSRIIELSIHYRNSNGHLYIDQWSYHHV